ncbi:murein biosynthesis integral membrane protein MurJ [Candidatus Saccharibacteria bacterium]|nr:murein biosynthesis integral membrane protein MurJ [Candidatus Saccharibacteria bacterium]
MTNGAKKIFRRASGKQTVGGAAIIISGAYLASRLLGLLRNRLLVAHFGIGPTLDAYNAAFRLPDLLFMLLISGAFAVSFIPVFTEYLEKDQREMAWRVTSSLLNFLVLATIIGVIILEISAGPLITLISPGFDPARHDMAVHLTRIMLLTPVFFAISSVLGSIQQAFQRFLFFSLAGVFYNLGIIIGIVWLTSRFGIYGVAYGVVLGVVMQAVIQLGGLVGLGYRWRPMINLRLAGARKVLTLMIPRGLDQGIDQVNYVVETIIGSTLAKGSITAFSLANDLKNVPLVLISSSIATAVFPRLAARAAAGGERSELVNVYVGAARLILFLAIPSAVVAVIGRGYIVRLLYGFGSPITADTLGWFAGSIIFSSLFMLVSRVYFAMQDTRTPLYTSLGSIPLNMLLSFWLAHMYGVAGMAMAASFVATVETVVLMWLLRRRFGSFGETALLRGVIPMATAGLAMAGMLYFAISRFIPLYASDRGFSTLAPKFVVLVGLGGVIYFGLCYLLRVKEVKQISRRLVAMMSRSTELT